MEFVFWKFPSFFFLVKIQWHYIPEHCITELENNIMYANFNLFQYAFARSSSNTQNLLSTIRSILEELYISNASSSGFDPHILCLTFSLYDVSKGTFNYTNFLFSTHWKARLSREEDTVASGIEFHTSAVAYTKSSNPKFEFPVSKKKISFKVKVKSSEYICEWLLLARLIKNCFCLI